MGLIIQKHANITKMLILFVIICILNCVDGSIKCPSSGGASGTNAVSGSIFKFGDPGTVTIHACTTLQAIFVSDLLKIVFIF